MGFLSLSRALGALLVFLGPASAIFRDEAYSSDYHLALLGFPQHAPNTFFHRPDAVNKAALLYTVSEQNFIGAVNPRDGSLIWRHRLDETNGTVQAFLRATEGHDAVVSAVGTTVTAWRAADGRVSWERQLQADGAVTSVEVQENGDVIALVSTGDIYNLNATDGAIKWSHQDTSSDTPLSVSTSSKGKLYYASITSSMLKSYKIKVTMFDIATGEKSDTITLDSQSEVAGSEDILAYGGRSSAPIMLWTDSNRKSIKANVLGSKNVVPFTIEVGKSDVTSISAHVPHDASCPSHFLVHYQTADSHWADVFDVNEGKGTVARAYSTPKTSGRGTFSASCADGQVYFTQNTPTETKLFSATSPLIEIPITSFNVPGIVPEERPYPVRAVSDVLPKSPSSFAVRSAILLSTGDWILVQNGQTTWARHESLANIVRADFAEMVDDLVQQSVQEELVIEEQSNLLGAYGHRITRHIGDLRHLPDFFRNLPQKLERWFLDFRSGKADSKAATFGFDKLVIVETANGRIIALRPADGGQILFNSRARHDGDSLSGKVEGWTLTGQKSVALTFESSESGASDTIKAVPRLTYAIHDGILVGKHDGKEIWRYVPVAGQHVVSVHSSSIAEPVASIGKALGDRRVLYKYLNANAIVAVATDEKTNTMSVTLVDATSGEVFHTQTQHAVDVSRPIPVAMSENWFIYSVAKISPPAISQGYLAIMTELYESSVPDDRGALGKGSNFSSIGPLAGARGSSTPHIISQAFHVPEEIAYMTTTQTRQGITSRHIIAVLPGSHSIVSIPRQAVDPRRPVGKAPSAAQATEEELVQYGPVIDFDPKWHLTHKRQAYGISNVVTTPTLMESTGLVFAYGFDVFGTRIAPSGTFDILGASFNKVQLVLTVVGLLLGTVGVKPLVHRKQTNTLWQA